MARSISPKRRRISKDEKTKEESIVSDGGQQQHQQKQESENHQQQSKVVVSGHSRNRLSRNMSVSRPPEHFKLSFQFSGEVQYNSTYGQTLASAQELMRTLENAKEPVVIAFDSKFPYTMAEGAGCTSVITVCHNTQLCTVYHLMDLKYIPQALIDCFHHPKVVIVGYCLDTQFKKLFLEQPYFKLDIILDRCVDVEMLANRLQPRKLKWGLNRLAGHYLNLQINDDFRSRNGPYQIVPLHVDLKKRTATDTQIAYMLYKRLKSIEERLQPPIDQEMPPAAETEPETTATQPFEQQVPQQQVPEQEQQVPQQEGALAVLEE